MKAEMAAATASAHSIRVRLASHLDLPGVLALQREWLEAGASGDKSEGYLAGSGHSSEQLLHCIRQGGVAVASVESAVVGYYLFDNDSGHPQTREYASRLEELQSSGVISTARVCARAQVAIERSWHRCGVTGRLLTFLTRHNAERFDAVFGVVYRDNPKLAAHLKVGWRIVAERDDVYFVVRMFT